MADVEEVLAVLDKHLGRCECQGRQGEKHDVYPPCRRRVLAHELIPIINRKA